MSVTLALRIRLYYCCDGVLTVFPCKVWLDVLKFDVRLFVDCETQGECGLIACLMPHSLDLLTACSQRDLSQSAVR